MVKRAVVVGLALLLAGAVAVALVGGGDDDGGGRSAASTTTTLPLTPTAKVLVKRLAAARRRTLHVVYTGDLPQPAGARLTVEVWWKGDRSRQTLVAEAPGQGRQETSGFVLEDGNVVCQRTEGRAWACQQAGATATPGGRTAGVLDALVAQVNGKDVTVAKARVGEAEVDCYTLDAARGDVVCLRGDDVPVKFTFSGAELLASTVERAVDDDVFDPPAKVRKAPSTTTTTRG